MYSEVFFLASCLHLMVVHVKPDDLQFQCTPQLGCGIFDSCTLPAMNGLRKEMRLLINTTLENVRTEMNISIANLDKSIHETTNAVTENLRLQIQDTLKEELDSLGNRWNASLDVLEVTVGKGLDNARKESKNFIAKRTGELDMRLRAYVRNVQKEMKVEIQEEIAKIRDTTREIMESKIKDVVGEFSSSLARTREELEKTFAQGIEEMSKETEVIVTEGIQKNEEKWSYSLRTLASEIYDKLAIHTQALDHVETKINELTRGIQRVDHNCESKFGELDQELKEELHDIKKENMTRYNVKVLIDGKIQAAITKWNASLTSEFKSNLHNISLTRKGLCKVAYNHKCFWAIEPELATPFEEARYACLEAGGEAANIYSKEHYKKVVKYLRSLISRTRSYIDVWLATQINPENGVVTYQNGTEVRFLEWERGSPATGRSFLSWSQIYILVKKDPNAIFQGMVNSSPENIRDGILCEI